MENKTEVKAAELARHADAQLSEALPEPSANIVPVAAAEPELRSEIDRRMAELDMHDTQSVIKFGSSAQHELTELSDQMLEGVRNKDLGPAGASLRKMVTTIRGFDTDELDPTRKLSWWERLFRSATPVADVIARYEGVRGQIDRITEELLDHETILLKDIKFLDKLYSRSLEFYDELALYIAAGDAKIAKLDAEDIPALARAVDEADENSAVLRAQELRDLRAARDELERRVHDLRLTRQVTMQSLPSIRLVQENDKSLINKINSTMVNTIPLWRTQLAQAVTIFRSREAAGVVREANDLTNDLLTQNAENLQQANREVREQMERGVFDIASVKQANATLIATIEESLRIADDGRAHRAAAESELAKMETELKNTLAAARARTDAPTNTQSDQPTAG